MNRSDSLKVFDKMHVQPERLFFYLHFALDIILGDRCDRKKLKTTRLWAEKGPAPYP